ncbi:calcium-binding protein [Aestuariibius sp. 2305UL40-4]|uniref:calcium-binding protein n=1 Tax=Aestuariibius violaceus TaxID=3234132 RepID=UPI00398F3D0C
MDADGDGDVDTRLSDVTVTAPDGSATRTVTTRNQDGSLREERIETSSADGLTTTVTADVDGDGDIDTRSVDTLVRNPDGSTTRTVTVSSGDGTLLSEQILMESADRRTLEVREDRNGDGAVDIVTHTVEAVDGSMSTVATGFHADGSVAAVQETDVSANGLSSSTRTDLDGDGVFETVTTQTTTLNSDGSRSALSEAHNTDGSLRSQSATTVSDDGLVTTVQTDADGDGTFEQEAIATTVLNANGSTTETVETRAENGEVLSRSETVVSDDGLTTITHLDQDADGAFDLISTSDMVLKDDGSTTTTTSLEDAGGQVRERQIVTISDDRRSVTTLTDIDGDGLTDQSVIRIIADDGTVTTTTQNLATDGSLHAQSRVETSDDGLETNRHDDRDGDGVFETTTTELTTLNADGSVTTVSTSEGQDGSVFRTFEETISDDGLEITRRSDWNGDGAFDLTESVARVLNQDGSESLSEQVFAADGSLLASGVTTVSSDGRLTQASADSDGNGADDMASETRLNDDGSVRSATSWYSVAGTLLSTDILAVSGDGLTSTRHIDRNGDGEEERIITDVTTLNEDGSVTQTIDHRDYLNIQRAFEEYSISDDGLTMTARLDLDGDGVFDFQTEDTNTFAANGDVILTQTSVDGTDDLTAEITTTTSGDGLTLSRDVDYNGDDTTDREIEQVTSADSAWTSSIREYDETGALSRSETESISADGRSRTMSVDQDGDGDVDYQMVGEIDFDGTTTSAYTELAADGTSQNEITIESAANGLTHSASFDLDADGTVDITRTTTTSFTFDGSAVTTFTETFGNGTLAYAETEVSAADGLSGTTTFDTNGDGQIDGTNAWQTTFNADGSRETIDETRYADGDLRSCFVETVSADGRTIVRTDDYDGNGVADKITETVIRADGQVVETVQSFNEGGMPGTTFITTTSADGLETTVLRAGNLQTITRSAVDNGSYTWDNGVDGAGHIVVEHSFDHLGMETWTKSEIILTDLGATETVTASVRLDATAKDRLLDEAARLYDTVLDRDLDFTEIEVLIDHIVDGQLDAASLTTELMTSAEFTTRYGTMSDAEFVTQMYLNTFGRGPSLTELDTHLTGLDDGALTREDLAQTLADSLEHLMVGNGHMSTNNFDVIMNPAVFERSLDEAYARSLVENVVDVVYDRAATEQELAHLSSLLLDGTDTLEDIADKLRDVSLDIQGVPMSSLHGISNLTTFVEEAFQNALDRAPTAEELATWTGHISSGNINWDQFLASLAMSVEHEITGHVYSNGLGGSVPIVSTGSGSTIDGTSGQDHLVDTSGGATTINGGDSSDILVGGVGNDLLRGGSHNDFYIWSKGDGNDTIDDSSTSLLVKDTLELTDVGTSDVSLRRTGSEHLEITINSTGERIRVLNQFDSTGNGRGIEEIVFADGTKWSLEDILDRAEWRGDGSNNTFNGGGYGENIFGLGGADVLRGKKGDDTIVGGTGADELHGGSGNDTYIWSTGDGNDKIYDRLDSSDASITEVDTLRLTDVDSDGATLTRDRGSDGLLITIVQTGETINVFDRFASLTSGEGIERIEFADGTVWTLKDILEHTTVSGDQGNNTLNGLDYRDNLYGLQGDDTLNGGLGEDVLVGGAGNDTLLGGEAGDTYVWSIGDGNDTIDEIATSTTEIDTLRLTNVASTEVSLWRDNGSDGLRVTILDTGEIIAIRDQNYSIDEYQGIEAIEFSDGIVWTRGDIAMQTVLLGTETGETLSGLDYRDNIIGEAENDQIDGGGGNDTLIGGTGNDTLQGGTGDDSFIYNLGDGNDILEETSGSDRLVFGAGIDAATLVFERVGMDARILLPDGSVITVRDEVASRIETLEFADGTRLTAAVFGDISVTGTSGRDTMIGHDGNDVIDGAGGKDTIEGGHGDDMLTGGLDHDTLTGGAGDDVIDGGQGDDRYIYRYGDGNDTIIEDGGGDRLIFGEGIDFDEVTFTFSGDDLLVDVAGSGTLTLVDFRNTDVEKVEFAGGSVAKISEFLGSQIDGDSSANLLVGLETDDVIKARGGDDVIYGHGGDDVIMGGAGNDTIEGGTGNDIIYTAASGANEHGEDIARGGAGNDQIHGSNGSDVLHGDAGNDVLDGGNDKGTADVDILYGGSGDDELRSGQDVTPDSNRQSYGDQLYGEDGNDQLFGGRADDILDGGTGNDILQGDRGSDRIIGGAGSDTLTGGTYGTYADVFVFSMNDGTDTITDFEKDEDKIEFTIAGLDFSDLVVTDSVNGAQITYGTTDSITLTGISTADLTEDHFVFV